MHIVALCVICNMVAIFVQMSVVGWTAQNEKLSSWIVVTVEWPTSVGVVERLVSAGSPFFRQRQHTLRQIPGIAVEGRSEEGENGLQRKQCKENSEDQSQSIIHCPYTEDHRYCSCHQSSLLLNVNHTATYNLLKQERGQISMH
jgi:hypothetical protein